MDLETLLHNPNALPTAPKVVEELISSFDNPSVAVDDIARKLALDPVLSAKLLRLANSAYYHVSRSIGSVDDAVRMLGFVTVRTLVISSGLVSGFKTVPGLDLRRFWRYSLHAAVAAKWVAKKSGDNSDLSFTIAMMHAIGQLVIHAGMPEQAQELDKTVGPYAAGRNEAEMTTFGFDFSEVGAELARRWKFPEIFASSLAALPEPGPDDRMAAVAHLAMWVARGQEGGEPAPFPEAVGGVIGMDASDFESMPPLADLCAGLEELVH